MNAYISATIDTNELIHYHADKAHPLFIQRIEELQDEAAEKEKQDETISGMYSALEATEKAADELAAVLDYAADGSGYHHGTDYFESLRASKKEDREECLQEFIEDLRGKLGAIYAQLQQGKDQ